MVLGEPEKKLWNSARFGGFIGTELFENNLARTLRVNAISKAA